MENKDIKYYKVTKSINREEWNPGDYAENEYARVYFRIRTPGFDCVNGGFSEIADREVFHADMEVIFVSLGWAVEYADVTKDKQHLYIHPQEISGSVKKSDISTIAEALGDRIRYVDIYEDVYDVTDAEYLDMINAKSAEIRKDILKAAVTKRAYTFVSAGDIIEHIGYKHHLPRLGLTDGCGHIYGNKKELAYSVVEKCINDLVSEGKLFTMNQNERLYIRTPNKTEQKKMKINLDI